MAETLRALNSDNSGLNRYAEQLQQAWEQLEANRFHERLMQKDPTLWPGDEKVRASIAHRLGWVHSAEDMLKVADEITAFAKEVKDAGFRHIVLLGMGGSSLCPEVCARTFGASAGYPEMIVLDTTSPDAITSAEKRIDLTKSIFIPASKSGSTIETNSLFVYFWQRLKESGVRKPGEHFIAITDPDTSLGKLAADRGFRRTFINDPDIGGRFSALSYFGLVPMALIGIDIKSMLEHVKDSSGPEDSVWLGAVMAVLGKAGRDKVTLLTTPGLRSIGIWIEQLIAESTGKQGRGLLPVDEASAGSPQSYGDDRLFFSVELAGETPDPRIAELAHAGHPVVRIPVASANHLGAEFLRAEIATATAGALLQINPFDEPNVTESKNNTSSLLEEFLQTGKLPLPEADSEQGGLTATLSYAARDRLPTAEVSLRGVLRGMLQQVEAGDYVAILAYVEQNAENEELLRRVQTRLRDATQRAVTVGFGPRYLHSTGQLHKGGAANGVFLMLMGQPRVDVSIPGQEYSFAVLQRAQALGDFRSLQAHGRRAVIVDLGTDSAAGLQQAITLIQNK